MLNEINGLPAHALLVHAVVVLVPLAALCTILSVAWPTARARLGVVTPLVALAALVSVPMTMEAGHWLELRVVGGELLQTHIRLAQAMLPWTIALFVVAVGQWVWFRWLRPAEQGRRKVWPRIVSAVVLVLALVTAAGSTIQVVRVGEAGTRSVWTGQVSGASMIHQGTMHRDGRQ